MSLSTTADTFSADWLALREPHDIAARDPLLLRRFARVLRQSQTGTVRLLDLAAGSGAQWRALAPHLGRHQHWTLVDHDAALLAAQQRHTAAWASARGHRLLPHAHGWTVQAAEGGWRWQVRSHVQDLAPGGPFPLDLAAYDGITTNAFLDLVSSDWLESFVEALHGARRPLWATLSVDGNRRWQPADAHDDALHAAFQCHQAADKGLGNALGAAAPRLLAQRLRARGWQVHTAAAPWHIGPGAATMLGRLAGELAEVASTVEPGLPTAAWLSRRQAQILSGQLRARIGHTDLLALPPDIPLAAAALPTDRPKAP